MDIDTLQTDKTERRQKLMKEGKCFNCKTWGHRVKDCPKKATNQGPPPKPQAPIPKKKIFKGKESFAHIKAMIAELPDEEKDTFWKTVNEEGF